MKNIKKLSKKSLESGQVSKILIILILIVLVIIGIIYGITKFTGSKKAAQLKSENNVPEIPKPVYEVTLENTKFLLNSFQDLGNVLKSPLAYESDLITTERFIKVTIGAQNKGKNNINQYSWDVGNIVDSEGRNFISINDRAYSYLPKPDLCGALLKPEFKPIPCVKYYEVSKESKNLKVVVKITEPKKQESFLDLSE